MDGPLVMTLNRVYDRGKDSGVDGTDEVEKG